MKKLELNTSLKEKILEQLSLGVNLTKICNDKTMPSLTTVYKWCREYKEFGEEVAECRRLGCQTWLDTAMNELDKKDVPPNQIPFLREKLYMARWMASKLLGAYGDKQEIKQSGDSSLTIKWEASLPLSDHAHASINAHDGVQKDNAATLEDKQP